MLQFYVKKNELYYRGNNIHTESYTVLDKQGKEYDTEVEDINWENVEEMLKHFIYSPCHVMHCRKGRKLEFWESFPIKQWKAEILDMKMVTTYKKYSPSLKEIFQYEDSDLAIQYLKERDTKITRDMAGRIF